MAIIARAPKTDYQAAPEGLHAAVCIDVVDLGLVPSEFGTKHKVQLRWALDEVDDQGRQYFVSRRYTLTLHKKAALRQALEMWRGKPLTEQEAAGFDLEKLLHVACQVQVVHNATADGNVFANVQAVIPLAKGQLKPPVPADYVRMKDRAEARHVSPSDETGPAYDDDVPF